MENKLYPSTRFNLSGTVIALNLTSRKVNVLGETFETRVKT